MKSLSVMRWDAFCHTTGWVREAHWWAHSDTSLHLLRTEPYVKYQTARWKRRCAYNIPDAGLWQQGLSHYSFLASFHWLTKASRMSQMKYCFVPVMFVLWIFAVTFCSVMGILKLLYIFAIFTFFNNFAMTSSHIDYIHESDS